MRPICHLFFTMIAINSTASCGQGPAPNKIITVSIGEHQLAKTTSLDKAINLARVARRKSPQEAIVIQLPAGTIYLATPIALSEADAGTAKAPLVLRGQLDGSSVIAGAMEVGRTTSADVRTDLKRTAPQLRPIPSAAFIEGSAVENRLFLFEGEQRLNLSSWPEAGYATDWKKTGTSSSLIRVGGAIPSGDQLVVDGFLYADWQHKAFAAKSDGRQLTLSDMKSEMPMQASPRLRLLNIQGPLRSGHYTFDRGTINVRGFAPGDVIEVAIASSLFTLDHADHIQFEKIALEKTSGTAIKIVQSSSVSLSDCYIGLTGGYALEADGGRDLKIDRCVVTHSASGGFRINGGDRTTLTPSRHSISNSAISEFGEYIRSYAPAISLSGVGNRAVHNLIATAPHAGIILSGNDNLIDGNELHHLVCDTNDASAIYMGRDWTQRGNQIINNYIHDLAVGSKGSTVSGVYLDDQFSGTEISGNVFSRMPHGVFLGGGRDNLIQDNIFVAMERSAIWLDNRGVSWQSKETAPGGLFQTLLTQSPYRSQVWRLRYPQLSSLLANKPGTPINNIGRNNVLVGSTLLWASPMSLSLNGDGNITRPAITTSAETPLHDIFIALGKPVNTLTVGPHGPMLYRNRLKNPATCAT